MHRQCNLRPQLVNYLQHRAVELVQLLPIQSSVKGDANVGAGQPKFDVIDLVDNRILGAFQLAINQHEPKGSSL